MSEPPMTPSEWHNRETDDGIEMMSEEQTCSNCKHFAEPYKLCCYSLGDEDYDCRGRNWEVKEK